MKLQIRFKQGLNEIARVEGLIHVANQQLIKAYDLERLIEDLTGLRAHVDALHEKDEEIIFKGNPIHSCSQAPKDMPIVVPVGTKHCPFCGELLVKENG